MKRNRFGTYMTMMLVLALVGPTQAQSMDWQDAYKRFIPEVHRAYLIGLHQGINDAGGMRPNDWAIINDMMRRWNSTDDLLKGQLQERKRNGEEITGSWVLKIYVTLLREHAFLCGHPIWTDTGTKDWCFKAMPDAGQ